MTVLLILLALAAGGPFLFRSIERHGIQHRSLSLGWKAALAVCIAVPVLIVAVDWRATALSRLDVPLPLLVLVPIAWGIWLLFRREAENGQHAA